MNIKEKHQFSDQLSSFIKDFKPSVMIETGVQTGASSKSLLEALTANNKGVLYSIDPNNQHNMTHPRWHFCLGKSYEWLPKIYTETQAWDIFLHDSDHAVGCQVFEYEFAWRCLKPGGYLLTDDHNWNVNYRVWDKFKERYGVEDTMSLGSVRGVQKPTNNKQAEAGRLSEVIQFCSERANEACIEAGLKPYLPHHINDEDYLLNAG